MTYPLRPMSEFDVERESAVIVVEQGKISLRRSIPDEARRFGWFGTVKVSGISYRVPTSTVFIPESPSARASGTGALTPDEETRLVRMYGGHGHPCITWE